MNIWEFIDKHPLLTVVLLIVLAGCVPSFSYVKKS